MSLTILIPIIVVMFVVMFFQSRAARKRQQEQRESMESALVPGAWVMTTAGFYGRFVESDGQVMILETVDGTETFWSTRAMAQVVDAPPFQDVLDAQARHSEADHTDEDDSAKSEDNSAPHDTADTEQVDDSASAAKETEESSSADTVEGASESETDTEKPHND